MRRALSVLGVAVVTMGCSDRDELPKVRLWALAPPETVPSEEGGRPPLRFAVALRVSPREAYRPYGELAEALARKLGRPVKLILRRTLPETLDLLRKREADFAEICARGFVQGRADIALHAVAVPVVGGGKSHPSLVITSPESEVNSVNDLAARTFAIAEPSCALELVLAGQEKERLNLLAKRTPRVWGHERAIDAVAERLVDGALVDGAVYRRLALTEPGRVAKTRVLGTTGPYTNAPIVVHSALPSSLRAEVEKAFLALHTDEVGRAALARHGIDRFVAPDGAP